MIALCIGLLIGYVLAIPPGPIGVAAARSGLRKGIAAARMLAIGAGLFDVAYCYAAMTASASIASLLQVEKSSPLTMTMGFVVATAIALVGVHQYRNPVELAIDNSSEEVPSSTRAFVKGAAYALANLANPTFIPSLVVMSAYIMGLGLVGRELSDRLMFSLGFGLGNVLWLITLVRIVLRFRDRLPQSTFLWIQRLMAATVVVFSIITGLRLALMYG
ncbi:MAG: hypothetical protein RLZZ273_1239 [Bacteroidota bacterium]|jgi:threonine/homoserine/homoserine lactone efflux protein